MENLWKVFVILVTVGIGYTLGNFVYGWVAIELLGYENNLITGSITGGLGVLSYYSYVFLRKQFNK